MKKKKIVIICAEDRKGVEMANWMVSYDTNADNLRERFDS